MRKARFAAAALLVAGSMVVTPRAQQGNQPDDVAVRPITPPSRGLPLEAATARVKKFSFIAYGDTRSGGPSPEGEPAPDGLVLQSRHSAVVDAMIAATRRLASTEFPVRFVVSS